MIRFNEEKKANEICIIEIFSSLNGEGWAAGLPTVFIRTMGCNLRCKFGTHMSDKEGTILNGFCDTPECFSEKHFKEMYPDGQLSWYTAKEIFDKVQKMEEGWRWHSICLTGGEPLMEENKDFMIHELLPLFIVESYDVSVETNGSIDYTDYKAMFGYAFQFSDGHREGLTLIADYKLPSSGMSSKMLNINLAVYDETDIIKMVVSDKEEDWKELDEVVQSGTAASIYISPMFGQVDTEKLWHYAEQHADVPVKVQVQLHKVIFSSDPNKKGV